MRKNSLLNGKEYETLNDEIVKLAKEIKTLKDKNVILTKENELLNQILALKEKENELLDEGIKFLESRLNNQEDDEIIILTKENELLNQILVLKEKEKELFDEYIKLLESGSNNQEDDDTKLYPEYHTHDTFKVHNKLAEVVSVLVDKDDDVYGYEVKFVDSSDTFIVYPEEIED